MLHYFYKVPTISKLSKSIPISIPQLFRFVAEYHLKHCQVLNHNSFVQTLQSAYPIVDERANYRPEKPIKLFGYKEK
jgi:hypothetical protein